MTTITYRYNFFIFNDLLEKAIVLNNNIFKIKLASQIILTKAI